MREPLIAIYEGPQPFAELLRTELEARGIASVISVEETDWFAHAYGALARQRVLVSLHDYETRPRDIEACLAFVTEQPEGEGAG